METVVVFVVVGLKPLFRGDVTMMNKANVSVQ